MAEISVRYLPERLRGNLPTLGANHVAFVNETVIAYTAEYANDTLMAYLAEDGQYAYVYDVDIEQIRGWVRDMIARNMTAHAYMRFVLLPIGSAYNFANTKRSPTDIANKFMYKYIADTFPKATGAIWLYHHIAGFIVRESRGPCFVRFRSTVYYRLASVGNAPGELGTCTATEFADLFQRSADVSVAFSNIVTLSTVSRRVFGNNALADDDFVDADDAIGDS